MIKWSEFSEGGSLYEAYLPEHDLESSAWLLRWSCNGHIIEERHVRLIWPPRFGPDVGDVAQIEASLDVMLTSSRALQPPANSGNYVRSPFSPPASEPIVLAALAVCLAEYVEAELALGLSQEQSRAFLDLPERAKADGLYPMAITPDREGRMRRVIALASLLERDNRARLHRAELIAAVLAEEVSTIERILAALGLSTET